MSMLMRRTPYALVLAAGLIFCATGAACPPEDYTPELQLEIIRKAGRTPEAFAAMLRRYDHHPDPAMHRVLDTAAGQRDAVWSRLYWHTDLASAKSRAASEGKPILYLRMLGKLTDEYSCANSRFFRTALYANAELSKTLREKFVLVWESERPVPVVTIDYGDGRVLKRTITGNSAHYVLDAKGSVVDVLPGLFDPATFGSILASAADAAAKGTDDARRAHLDFAESELALAWARDASDLKLADADSPIISLSVMDDPKVTPATPPSAEEATNIGFTKRRVELKPVQAIAPREAPGGREAGRAAVGKTVVEAPILAATAPAAQEKSVQPAVLAAPDAGAAAPRAMGKCLVERPVLRAISPSAAEVLRKAVASADDTVWEKLASLYASRPATHLDERSVRLIRTQNPAAYGDPAALMRTVDRFQRAMAEDTVRNNYQFRRQALAWLREAGKAVDVETLNARIYSELFLTPKSDPWLGLVPADTYSALCNDGCADSK
ncbi:MAG TPA: hypothetical protein VEB22_00875 [Phycisphaerales bacterium]|nr:hypothetical protein [Phycisphaerales bacterium]